MPDIECQQPVDAVAGHGRHKPSIVTGLSLHVVSDDELPPIVENHSFVAKETKTSHEMQDVRFCF